MTEPVRDRPRAEAGGNQLSPRELEVVQLVVIGRTNPEIASILCRSPRTISAQLSKAMRKLGASSRTALAVSVIRLGLASAGQHPVADSDRPTGQTHP